VAIFYGISLIWERDLGILHTFLASPAYRSAPVTSKAASAGVRAVAQAVIVGVLARAMEAHLRLEAPAAGRRAGIHHAGSGHLLDVLARYRLPGQDA